MFTDKPGVLTNDFFVNLLDMGTVWNVSEYGGERLRGCATGRTGQPKWTATANDLVFGSNSHAAGVGRGLRHTTTTKEKFVEDFVAAWVKVMNNDRFDLA